MYRVSKEMRIIVATRLISLLALLVSLPLYAYDFQSGGIYYSIGDNNTVSVTRGETKYSGDVVIPKQVLYNGTTYLVTGIAQCAFDKGLADYNVTSVTIPSSVTKIESEAFIDQLGLEAVYITDLEAWCKIVFTGNLYDTNPLAHAHHFYLNGKEIKDLIIPNNVSYIEKGSFWGCSSLTSVTIPKSVTSIGGSAFSGCSGLTSVTIPNSVTSIGSSAFAGCSGLNSIKVETANSKYDSRNNCNAIIETELNTIIAGCKNTTIPNSVTSIGSSAFAGCRDLTSVTIPNSVTSIGSSAFNGCSGLTSITIPNSVISIGSSAFNGCSGLTSITIPNSVISIGSSAFEGCSDLTSITIPNSVTSIGGSAFYRCSGLTSITIPNSVTSIGGSAFQDCSGLTSITIPNSVTSIGGSAFDDTGWYNNQPDGALYLDNCLIGIKGNNKPSGALVIKDGTRLISDDSFWLCSSLTSIIIPNSVTSIGRAAFYNCSGLTSITIPNSVASIGNQAFDGTAWYNNQPDGLVYAGKVAYKYKGEMPSNTEIVIKEGTLGVSTYAFDRCNGLTSVTIPKSVIKIGERALYDCSNLDFIFVDNDNKVYDSRDNCNAIIESSTNRLISGCKNTTIPKSVTSIGDFAFQYCSSLTSITIPNSVINIEDYTFYGCKSLTTITSEIEKPFIINSSTFSDDTYKVAELIVPYGTKSVYQGTEGWNKFTMITEAEDKDELLLTIDGITYQGTKSAKTVMVNSVDKNLTSLEIPASVKYDGTEYQVTGIDNDAFKGSNMAALIWNVEAALPNNAFSNASIGSNFLLYVKSASYAPSSVKNVVVDGMAQTILLADDGGQFCCPQAFTARNISYTHNYSMETGGNGKGWETIALPFDVQKISHNTRGEVVPFPAYNSSSNQKPFWLASFSGSGFRRTAAVLANEPYIIAMPNSSNYRNEYNLAGDVTFSAENVQVLKTPTFSGTFVPAFAPVAQSSRVMALNVNNRYVKYSGSYDAGSRFISNLRDVRPFEAYINDSSTRGVIEINFDDDMTDINDILISANEDDEVTIHILSGLQIVRTNKRDFDAVWQLLPKGVYIVNGKKMIK